MTPRFIKVHDSEGDDFMVAVNHIAAYYYSDCSKTTSHLWSTANQMWEVLESPGQISALIAVSEEE